MRICYINFSLNNPRDLITIKGLRENGVIVNEIADQSRGFKKYFAIIKAFRANKKNCDVVMVGYAGSLLVIFMRILTRKPIIYNALATFYDSMIVSRFHGSPFSFSALWYYIIDFFTFRLARHSFVECESQKDLIVRVFKVHPDKLSVHFVGVNDAEFYVDTTVLKRKRFTVVFRGMFLPEAGADVVVRAAKALEEEDVDVRIIGRGLLKKEIEKLAKELDASNLELITDRLSMDQLRKHMLECHVSLGQLADHPRVHTTIPHKAFESLAMKLPYLTGANKGVMEILKDGKTCFAIPPGDYHALAQKIIELKNNQTKLKEVQENAYALYAKEFTPIVLAQKIITKLEALLKD